MPNQYVCAIFCEPVGRSSQCGWIEFLGISGHETHHDRRTLSLQVLKHLWGLARHVCTVLAVHQFAIHLSDVDYGGLLSNHSFFRMRAMPQHAD